MARFGVSPEQVVRDHVISHALAAISTLGTDRVVFFGGTALSRTLLAEHRLSEDIDLIALGDRRETGAAIQRVIERQFRRTLGTAVFTPGLGETRHPDPSVLAVGRIRIQVQLLTSEGYPRWPTEVVDIEQRYTDAPDARLRVLTPAAFVAAKLAAWTDRRVSRDLYDLWALAQAGRINDEAAQLFGRHGQYTTVENVSFVELPTNSAWQDSLGHQGFIKVSPEEAARVVSAAIAAL
ncbi:nucleotidyl transferase AbiEii/AbiGii toxin family protein [Microbacterium sp.]|uniref:nucleotidyl transferase AbiEii/AbiGii toxin family protein n=1 Tax=Microbacterium sp. TaxID=51671 RepID=UPI003A844382